MSFKADMDRIVQGIYERVDELYDSCVNEAFKSITVGSALTGAPGQPVKSGELLKSYHIVEHGRYSKEIVSDKPYAEIIENNRRGAQLRSKVGGFHSIKLTRLGWGRVVSHEARRLKTKSPGIRSSSRFEL